MNKQLAQYTRIETTAIKGQFGDGPATDCWIDQDDGGDTVTIGYGVYADRATVQRSLIRVQDNQFKIGQFPSPAGQCDGCFYILKIMDVGEVDLYLLKDGQLRSWCSIEGAFKSKKSAEAFVEYYKAEFLSNT